MRVDPTLARGVEASPTRCSRPEPVNEHEEQEGDCHIDCVPMEPSFDWSLKKNRQLIGQRGFSVERIVSGLEPGDLVDVLKHPNQEGFPGQLVYLVEVAEYIHLVPFVIQAEARRFLQTITPGSEATREYRRNRQT